MLHETSFHNMVWWGPLAGTGTLKNAVHKVNLRTATRLLDTLQEAESHIARAIALAPDNAAGRRMMGRLYMALGSGTPADSLYAKAAALFESSLALEPSSAEGYYGLGCSLFRQNRSPEALAAVNTSLSFDSTDGSAYLTLGEVYMDMRNVTVAFACFENAARLGLRTAGEYVQLAGHYRDDQAERLLLGRFASLRVRAPGVLGSTVRAGLRMLSMYHPGIAMELSSRALEADSSCAEAHLVKTGLYLEEGDTLSAVDEYIEAFNLGTASYWSYSRFPRELIESAYSRMPDNDVLLYLVGQPFASRPDSPSAISTFQNAVRRRPTSIVAAYLLGRAYEGIKDTAEAIRWFDRVMALPGESYPLMYWKIYESYLQARQIPKAVHVYRECLIEDHPYWPRSMFSTKQATDRYPRESVLMAATYCAVGYECSWKIHQGIPGYWKAQAIDLFTRAIRILPESALPYSGLGSLFIDLGEKDRAYRYYTRAAALGSPDAMQSLAQMGRVK